MASITLNRSDIGGGGVLHLTPDDIGAASIIHTHTATDIGALGVNETAKQAISLKNIGIDSANIKEYLWYDSDGYCHIHNPPVLPNGEYGIDGKFRKSDGWGFDSNWASSTLLVLGACYVKTWNGTTSPGYRRLIHIIHGSEIYVKSQHWDETSWSNWYKIQTTIVE